MDLPITAADLAPGDVAAAVALDLSRFDFRAISDPDDPLLPAAYARLWAAFGVAGEVEQVDVLHRRLARDPRAARDGLHLLYELVLVRDRATGGFAAVRDHTAIVPVPSGAAGHRCVVHLSHVLIAPPHRGTGLIGWLRAWPVGAAARCLRAAGAPPDAPVTLVAEMEHPDPAGPATLARLRSYERAGFRKVDPRGVPYVQPDFRPPAVIDATGVRPLPMALVVRRVGHESDRDMPATEVRDVVAALYGMYARDFRPADMAVVHAGVGRYPATGVVGLVPPTEVVSPG